MRVVGKFFAPDNDPEVHASIASVIKWDCGSGQLMLIRRPFHRLINKNRQQELWQTLTMPIP